MLIFVTVDQHVAFTPESFLLSQVLKRLASGEVPTIEELDEKGREKSGRSSRRR